MTAHISHRYIHLVFLEAVRTLFDDRGAAYRMPDAGNAVANDAAANAISTCKSTQGEILLGKAKPQRRGASKW